MNEVIILIFVVFLIAVFLAAIAMPVVAIVLIVKARRRIEQLESQVNRLETALSIPQHEPQPPAPEPVTPPPVAPTPPPSAPPRSVNAYQLESTIGRRWVGWVAVVLILFATAFFLKYAFDNRWIGELGRVAIGFTAGIAMALAGFYYYRQGWRLFSQILTAGGIALLYLSTYAAFDYYHLVDQKIAFVFLAILIAGAAVISLFYNAPAIAMMALIGGLLTPILLHSDRNQYRSLFAYLFVLDVGTLALLKHWRGLSSVAYFGTQLLFWLWYSENYQHQLRDAVLVFQTAIFLLFLLAHLAREFIRRETASIEDALLLIVNPFAYFATAYQLLNPTHHNWMGAFAVVMALVYGGAAKLLLSRGQKPLREILLLIAVALTFVTIAIPIQLRFNWITIAWAFEGLAILWAALEIRSVRLRAHAFALFALAFGKFLFWDTPYGTRASFIPVFNRYFLSSLAVTICFLGGVYLYERARVRNLIDGRVTKLVLGLFAALSFWILISIETHTFFVGRALTETNAADANHQRWLGQMALSVIWALYAATLAAAGFMQRIAVLRWAALALFALTIIKAMLVDIAELQQLYRIIVLAVLGILLLLLAWGYHKAFHSREAQVPQHE